MSAVDEILASLPVDQLASQLDADPQEVRAAAAAALPALLGGLSANAKAPSGAASIEEAIGQHAPLSDGTVDLASLDTADGAKIAQHIFGAQQDQVVQQLGGLDGVSGSLVKKLIPVLAPIVLGYLAKQMGQQSGSAGGGGSIVETILNEVLKGATQGSRNNQGSSAGSIIGDILGGLLGGGRK